MSDRLKNLLAIQYPNSEVASLQRAITQIKNLLEDEEFYNTLIAGSDVSDEAVLSFDIDRIVVTTLSAYNAGSKDSRTMYITKE